MKIVKCLNCNSDNTIGCFKCFKPLLLPMIEKLVRIEISRKGGRKTSDAKKRAAQENGKKGGRPRKTFSVPSEGPNILG